ncbi:unnamed protein product [Tuber melanosporum]|uniref:(Perigord truffle) hypothetical protein n=1 Tax=Tuber melanosporum (strain Mel28) TaxID=656061 RepID=D5GEJ3_TUBMM|nr:uncharacterized protein GSTUM_00006518001 [Tuber melanosporum]CAZ82936.1 unnamed protein product [Tuber melanosporum]
MIRYSVERRRQNTLLLQEPATCCDEKTRNGSKGLDGCGWVRGGMKVGLAAGGLSCETCHNRILTQTGCELECSRTSSEAGISRRDLNGFPLLAIVSEAREPRGRYRYGSIR